MAKLQVPDVLTISTKRKLKQKTLEDIEQIVSAAIDEVNLGSVTTLDELTKKAILTEKLCMLISLRRIIA